MAAGKKAGRKSQASNDFLEPSAPIINSATNIGTSRAFNNGAVTIAFSLPALSPAATSFTVTASTGQTATGASSPIVVPGIASSATPTFTVTATNAAGTSAASAASSAVTITTVPATPSAPTATAEVNQDRVSWTAPVNGGSAIIDYFVSSSDGKSATVTGTSHVFAQEANTAQTYTVRARNANGNSNASVQSNNVTTLSPFFPFFPFFPYFPFFPSFGPYFPPSFGGQTFCCPDCFTVPASASYEDYC